MKKLIVVLMIALLPTLAFALDFQVGGTAMYKGLLEDIESGVSDIGLDDFTFGAEARLSLGLLQGAAAVLYYPGDYPSLVALTDIGVTLNLAIVRLGAGIGPNFYIPLNDSSPKGVPVGLNLKGAVDLQLGGISVGLVGYYYLASLSDLGEDMFTTAQPWLGLTVLFKVF